MSIPDRNPFAVIDAMKAIANALEGLDDGAVARIVRWLIDEYDVSIGGSIRTRRRASQVSDADPAGEELEFETAADLMSAAQPKTDSEKALVAAYWFQVIQNQSDLESQAINTELKHQGHGVSNITNAFDALMKQKPQLAIQLRKSGSSKQARKKYKLTTEGIQKVRRMLTSEGEGDEND